MESRIEQYHFLALGISCIDGLCVETQLGRRAILAENWLGVLALAALGVGGAELVEYLCSHGLFEALLFQVLGDTQETLRGHLCLDGSHF